MAKSRPRDPQPEQLVFPFQLRVGDVIVEDGVRAEVVASPRNSVGGKMTHAWVRSEGETVRREITWEAWRKVRVVQRAA